MDLHVALEVVGAAGAVVAELALEGLLLGVDALVAANVAGTYRAVGAAGVLAGVDLDGLALGAGEALVLLQGVMRRQLLPVAVGALLGAVGLLQVPSGVGLLVLLCELGGHLV